MGCGAGDTGRRNEFCERVWPGFEGGKDAYGFI
jgi:hypothetical protein